MTRDYRRIAESYDFRVLPRGQFMMASEITTCSGETMEQETLDALRARAGIRPGAFVLFDPIDAEDGYLLVGDNADELARECVEHHGLEDL